LELAPVVALHNAANGANVATVLANDNGVSPATSTPKPKRAPATSPASPLDAAAVVARIRTLRDAEIADGAVRDSQWSTRPVAQRAGVSPALVGKLMKGGSVKPEYVAMVAAILPPA